MLELDLRGWVAVPGPERSEQTAVVVEIDGYREHLLRLYLLDPVEAWTPAFAPLKRLTFSSKHHLLDLALAARLVGVGARGLLLGEGETVSPSTGTWLGALFESLAVQSVRVYADVRHLRWLRGQIGDRLADAVVLHTGPHAYRRPDGIAVVPLALLAGAGSGVFFPMM